MEEELKKLLLDLIEQQNLRQDTIQKAREDIERSKVRQKDALKRFEQEFQGDINSGLYNMTDGQIKRNIEEGKNIINERYKSSQKRIRGQDT